MHIVYHSIAKGNLSSIAASIHLNKLPNHSVPSIEQIKEYTLQTSDDFDLVFNGIDDNNNSIYSLNRLSNPSLLITTVMEVFKVFDIDIDNIKLINMEALNYIRNSIPSYLDVIGKVDESNLRYDEFNEFYYNLVDIVDSVKDITPKKNVGKYLN